MAMPNIENREAIEAIGHFPMNMRAKEVSEYMGIGLSTVWYWVKIGKIKSYRIGDRVTIFKRSDLDALIESSEGVAS